jgi:hypothetical protein
MEQIIKKFKKVLYKRREKINNKRCKMLLEKRTELNNKKVNDYKFFPTERLYYPDVINCKLDSELEDCDFSFADKLVSLKYSFEYSLNDNSNDNSADQQQMINNVTYSYYTDSEYSLPETMPDYSGIEEVLNFYE